MSNITDLKAIVEAAWDDRSLLKSLSTKQAIEHIIELLDQGKVRVAERGEVGEWLINEWIKKAILLYFPMQQMRVAKIGIFEYHDKIQLKKGYSQR